MTRSLFSPRPSPYYLVSMDFRRSSAGIRVMHMLCDALIRSGYEAYVFANVTNPQLMTPRLTNEVIALHKSQGVEPIVIYPEVVAGNPLSGNVVARYLLNRPGFLTGVGAETYGKDDLIFAYADDLQLPDRPANRVMYMPPYDWRVFRLPDDPAKRVPGKVCYYLGRGAQAHIDPAILGENAIEITPRSPGSWEELADVFQQCEYFYCTESSALAGEAALCGCVSVILVNKWAPHFIAKNETQGFGMAWGNEPELIEQARRTMPMLRELMIEQEKNFWPALDNFIELTQEAARAYQEQRKGGEGARWLAPRVISGVERNLFKAHLQDQVAPALELLVFDVKGQPEKLARTLSSINALDGLYATIHISVLAIDVSKVVPQANLDVVTISATGYMGLVNQRLTDSTAQWFMCLSAGDELTASGFHGLAMALAQSPEQRAVYADQMMRHADGRLDLMLRPDFNLDLLLSTPATMASHWVFQREAWHALGGFITDSAQAFELEYILRLVENSGLQGLGHISEALVISDILSLEDKAQERLVIEQHLRARGFVQAAVGSQSPGQYELDYGRQSVPVVSILIVIDEQLGHAQRCLESLLEQTTYGAYELLLLDRGNADPAVCDWLLGIEYLGVDHIRVLRYPAEASAQAIRNHAGAEARGEFLLFLDCAVGIIGQDWLQQLLNHGVRPEVGCVGAKLLGADGKVRHGGLLLGLGGTVASAFEGLATDAAGYMQRLQVDQNYTALSDQCLLVRQELFCGVGGFDEQMVPWAGADLCLKVQQAGYLNVWTPRVQLLVSDTAVVVVTPEQEDRLYERWLPQLADDPAYNRNFSLAPEGAFKLAESQLSWQPLSSCKIVPRVMLHADESLAGIGSRIIRPFAAMREQGLMDGVVVPELLSVVELERFQPDAIILQRSLKDEDQQALRRMKQFCAAFKVFELGNRVSMSENELGWLRRGLSYMDRLVVANVAMAQMFDGFNADIRVIETRLDPREWQDLSAARRCSEKPRVGWAGGAGDSDQLEMIINVLKDFADEVHWVVFGPCPASVRPFVHEVHDEVSTAAYPSQLAGLNLDLALAPLADTLANRARGQDRLLEYGACGFPVVCSDLPAYRGDLAVTRVQNTYEAWFEAIIAHLRDLDGAAARGDALRDQVRRDWMLEGSALVAWRNIWLPD